MSQTGQLIPHQIEKGIRSAYTGQIDGFACTQMCNSLAPHPAADVEYIGGKHGIHVLEDADSGQRGVDYMEVDVVTELTG